MIWKLTPVGKVKTLRDKIDKRSHFLCHDSDGVTFEIVLKVLLKWIKWNKV
jgi:hypothetical protein